LKIEIQFLSNLSQAETDFPSNYDHLFRPLSLPFFAHKLEALKKNQILGDEENE